MATMNFCPSCGSRQGAAANFCAGCGFKLDSINVPPPPKEALSDADFQARFTSCLSGKGFPALATAFQSKQAAMDFLSAISPELIGEVKELATHLLYGFSATGTIAGLDSVAAGSTLAAAAKVALASAAEDATTYVALAEIAANPEVLAALPALLVTVYLQGGDAAGTIHALVDCAIRAGVSVANFPYAREIVDTLDWFDTPEPLKPLPPAMPQLPPPPPDWQPMVIPMEDPAPPVAKSAGMPAVAKAAIAVGMAGAILGGLALGNSLVQQYGGGGTHGGGGATWDLHYSCGSSPQCAAVMGGPGGVLSSYSSYSQCQTAQNRMASSNVMQPRSILGGAGTWCSQ